MAVAFESFSIREYTARMRRVDASKCWPFDGDGRERQLPSIECRKYRWWSSELQIARSAADECERRADTEEQECGALSDDNVAEIAGDEGARGEERQPPATDGDPVFQQVDFVLPAQASTAMEDEEREEEGVQAKSPGKAKMRAPKKRSIVELFAVAPQIEAAEGGAEGDVDGKILPVVDGTPKEDPGAEELDKDAVEEPRKRKRDSLETLMRKKIKKNCVSKNIASEEKMKMKMKKKMKMKMKMKKKKKKLLKKQKRKNDIKTGIAKKERIQSLSLQSPVDFARLLRDSVIMKRFGKEINVPAHAQRKKQVKATGAPKQNKMKAIQTSKLKKPLNEPKHFPIQSILKNQKGVGALGLGKVQTTDDSQNGDQHHTQQLEKHVRFSGKDDILGHGEKHCFPLASPQMHSLQNVFSGVLDAPKVMDKSPEGDKLSGSNEAQMVTANENIVANCAVNEKTGQPLLLQHMTDVHDMTNSAISVNPQSNHDIEKTTLDDCVDLNNSVQTHSDVNHVYPSCPTEPPHHFHEDNLKVMNSIETEGRDSLVADDIGESGLSRTDAGGSLPSGSAAVVPATTIVRNSNSESSISSLSVDMVENNSNLYPAVKPHKDIYTCDSQFQSPCPPRKDMMSTILSSTGSTKQLYQKDMDLQELRQIASPMAIFHDKHTSGNIIGLPLNSHGEFIQMQSTGQLRFDQPFKKTSLVLGPIGSFLVHKSIEPSSMDNLNLNGKVPLSSVYVDQQKWFSEKSYSRDQSIVMPLSGLTELQDISHTEIRRQESMKNYDQFAGNLNVESNLFRVSCHGFGEQNKSPSYSDRATVEAEGALESGAQSIAQPTMRLMGKIFTVGRINKEPQSSGDRKILSDKEIITDSGPTLRISGETTPKCWPQQEWANLPTSGTTYENLMHTLETQKRHNTSNFYPWTVDPRLENAHLDRARVIMSGNGHQSVNVSHPHVPEEWFNKASIANKNFGPGFESVKMGLQAPQAACSPENVCQHLLLSSTHCKHSQSLSHSMTSTFPPSPAFHNPDDGKFVQFPSAQCSSQSLPHWLLNAGHRKMVKSSALSFSDSVPMYETCSKSRTNISSLPSPPLTSITSFPSFDQNSHGCFSDLPTPSSLVHSSLIPSFPAAKSSSSNNTCYWTMYSIRDGIKSKYSFPKSSDVSNKSRKRPLLDIDESLKPMKRTNFGMQDGSSALMGTKKGEQLHACTEHISKIQLRAYGDRIVKVNDSVKDVHVNAYAPSTSKLDTGSRSRPIKLSAGAKHILKPSMNMDQDNSMPTHSTIPFASGISSGNVPVSQKKPAKIYQF